MHRIRRIARAVVAFYKKSWEESARRALCPHANFDYRRDEECPDCGYNPLAEAW